MQPAAAAVSGGAVESPLPGAPAGGWHRRVWVLAGPIIISNLSTPLLGAVDTAVVGRLPDPAYIGGVAVGAIVFNFLVLRRFKWNRRGFRAGRRSGRSW